MTIPPLDPVEISKARADRNDEFTRLCSTDRIGRRHPGFAFRCVCGLLQLLHAAPAALRHLLSAPDRAAAIPYRRRDRDGVTGQRDRTSDTRPVSDRDGAPDRDGRAGGRAVRARAAAIRYPPAGRDGRAGAGILCGGAAALRFLRLLIFVSKT